MPSAAPCSRPAPARPSSRCRPWPTSARRLRRHAELPAHPAREGRRDGHRPASLRKACSAAKPSRPACATGSQARGIAAYQSYATADLGLIAYETSRARGPGAGRRRDRRDRPRPAPATRCPTARSARSWSPRSTRDYPLVRFGTGDLSAVLPGPLPDRPHQHAHQGLDGPRRPDRPRCAACSCTRRRWPTSSGASRRSRAPAWWSSGEMADDRMTLQGRGRGRAGRTAAPHRATHPRRHQAARRRSSWWRRAACRTTAR